MKDTYFLLNINLAQMKQKRARVTRTVGAKERRQVFFPPKNSAAQIDKRRQVFFSPITAPQTDKKMLTLLLAKNSAAQIDKRR
jgi:hypothetical protein